MMIRLNHRVNDVIERMKIAIGSGNGQGENVLPKVKMRKITLVLETQNAKNLPRDLAATTLQRLLRVQSRFQNHLLQRSLRWIITQWSGKLETGRDYRRNYRGARQWRGRAHLIKGETVKLMVGVGQERDGLATSMRTRRATRRELAELKVRGRREDGDECIGIEYGGDITKKLSEFSTAA